MIRDGGDMGQEAVPDWLPYYVRDHLAGARAGINAFARIARVHNQPLVRAELAGMHQQIQQEYQELRAMMAELGMRRASPTMVMAVVGELLERLKPNGSLIKRSVGADVLELEALISAVQAKARLWETLLAVSGTGLSLDAGKLRVLQNQAEGQRKTLIGLHAHVVGTAA